MPNYTSLQDNLILLQSHFHKTDLFVLVLFFVCIVFQLFEWWQHGIQFEDLGNFENLMWRLNVYTERKWNKNPPINYIDKIHL